MKTNSDEAIALITLLTQPPEGVPTSIIDIFGNIAVVVKSMDAENFRLRKEVQMLRAVLEQDHDKVC